MAAAISAARRGEAARGGEGFRVFWFFFPGAGGGTAGGR